jgi:hypothetical protein
MNINTNMFWGMLVAIIILAVFAYYKNSECTESNRKLKLLLKKYGVDNEEEDPEDEEIEAFGQKLPDKIKNKYNM